MSQCPACAQVNPDQALACEACGTPLVMRCPACATINVRARVRCHHCAALLDPALTPQDAPAETPAPPVVPTLSEDRDEVPDDWVLSLRDFPLIAAPAAMPAADPVPDPVADPDAPRAAAAPAEDMAARKVRRRAAVRRAQMSAQGRSAADGENAVLDVLVLEANPQARSALCQTLLLFGFRPHVAVSAAEAAGLSRRQPHVAAFLGLGSDLDPAETEALCRSLHDTRRGRPLALIAIGDRHRHADRIRMQLAGADRMLLRPVGRGDIARALDDCGLALPHDPRQHS